MANVFDQFDKKPTNVFDQFDAPAVNEPSVAAPVQKPTWRSKAEEVFQKLKMSSVGDVLKGVGESALSMGTGLAGTIAGGGAGLNASSVQPIAKDDPGYDYMDQQNFLEGRHTFTHKPDPVEAVQKTQEAMTYQPRTEAGQAINDAIAMPFEWYEKQAYDIASNAGDPIKHAPGATAAYTALMMLPAAFGMRAGKRGVKKAPGEKPAVPTTDTLRQEAGKLYAEADSSGAAVTAESFSGAMGAIEKKLTEAGFDKGLHPDTYRALKNLTEKSANNQTLKGVEINRQIINEARGALKPKDARMASIMMDVYDDWMQALKPSDMLMGDAKAAALYPKARELWHRKMKSDEIEWSIERAATRAGQFTGSGFENALRTEFRQILMNKKRRRMFNEKEIAALKMVADGGFIQNSLRALGRFAIRGPVSAVPTALAGSALGPVGAGAVALAGEVGRRGATAMTINAANKAAETMRQPKQ